VTQINDLYPIRNTEFETNEGLVTIIYFEKRKSFIEKLFFKKLADKKIKVDLDETGSFVWLQCDGSLTLSEIAVKLGEHFGPEFEKPFERTDLFIKQLLRNKFITLYQKVEKN